MEPWNHLNRNSSNQPIKKNSSSNQMVLEIFKQLKLQFHGLILVFKLGQNLKFDLFFKYQN